MTKIRFLITWMQAGRLETSLQNGTVMMHADKGYLKKAETVLKQRLRVSI